MAIIYDRLGSKLGEVKEAEWIGTVYDINGNRVGIVTTTGVDSFVYDRYEEDNVNNVGKVTVTGIVYDRYRGEDYYAGKVNKAGRSGTVFDRKDNYVGKVTEASNVHAVGAAALLLLLSED